MSVTGKSLLVAGAISVAVLLGGFAWESLYLPTHPNAYVPWGQVPLSALCPTPAIAWVVPAVWAAQVFPIAFALSLVAINAYAKHQANR